jgi:hypothetical protein
MLNKLDDEPGLVSVDETELNIRDVNEVERGEFEGMPQLP